MRSVLAVLVAPILAVIANEFVFTLEYVLSQGEKGLLGWRAFYLGWPIMVVFYIQVAFLVVPSVLFVKRFLRCTVPACMTTVTVSALLVWLCITEAGTTDTAGASYWIEPWSIFGMFIGIVVYGVVLGLVLKSDSKNPKNPKNRETGTDLFNQLNVKR